MGIEPTPQAWEARVLPLNYTRLRWPEAGYLSRPGDAIEIPFADHLTMAPERF